VKEPLRIAQKIIILYICRPLVNGGYKAMKIGFLFISSFMIFYASLQSFDKSGYYRVMASGDHTAIDSELVLLTHAIPREKEAYEGALLMKKAGLLHKPKDKLTTFRLGATKLETALAKDSSNGEYHFLRLIIQEHAPAVVHYNKDVDTDLEWVYRTFKTLSPAVQKAILDYSGHSKRLRANQLNG
jgi:hypothetical protein